MTRYQIITEYSDGFHSYWRWFVEYKDQRTIVSSGVWQDVTNGTAGSRWTARLKARRAARKHSQGYDFSDEKRRVEPYRTDRGFWRGLF